MPTKMQMPRLELVPKGTPNSQMVAIFEEPYRMSVAYAKIPEPGEGEVRVKIKWVGICGSDLEAYRGTRAPEFIFTPARLGHEVAGIIDKVGLNVAGLTPGMVVACRYVWGAYAQYLIAKPFNLKALPSEFPLINVSLIEILPGVLHSAELGEVGPEKDVLIMGQGVSGLVMTQVVRLFSPKTLAVTDLFPSKIALAKKYGATHTYIIPSPDTPTMEIVGKDFPNGFDVVIPCLLEGDGIVDAVDCAAQNGRIVLYGCIGRCNKPLDLFKVHRKRLDIFSTEPKRDIDLRRFFDEGVRLVTDGIVNTAEMVTHTFPLSKVQEAFQLRNERRDDVIHVLIDCENA